uniref:NADH-ubiquinone oxidoreductase chain 2 n=1 Tax=Blaptica dubia TaxID=132935 RepID=A0A0U2IL92_BLADU|nr:NADH dehydrogenase subunit 2 [Blaptica dubia]ALS20315.1 NADH dehydrogenase subunit 2 [Blaptica dubia]
MFNSSIKMMFFITLISGILITISSNSWFSAWMGLEINLLSFIPMMSNNENVYTSEASLKYFLVQALASLTLLFIIISKALLESVFSIMSSFFSNIMVAIPLLMKTGAAPLHWWFPSVMEGLSWMNCFILMTIQKITPLVLISYLINLNLFFSLMIILSILIGSIGGYNQTSIRKILTYSSINHLGWMFSAMSMSENMWMMYFTIYSLLTFTVIYIVKPLQISFINQTFLIIKDDKIMKFMLFSSLLSLGGLPPFLGFLPKWIIIQSLTYNSHLWISSIMVILSLITLYYYLRLSYSSFIMLNSQPSWSWSISHDKLNWLSVGLMSLSVLGLTGCTVTINY